MGRGQAIMRRYFKMATKQRPKISEADRNAAREAREKRREVAQMRALGVDEDGVLSDETSGMARG